MLSALTKKIDSPDQLAVSYKTETLALNKPIEGKGTELQPVFYVQPNFVGQL